MLNTFSSTATLTNCTLSGNSASGDGFGGGFGGGGGVFNTSKATLTNCTVSGNSAVAGGGIANQGTLNVASSNIMKNQATSAGGGISTTGPGVAQRSPIRSSTRTSSTPRGLPWAAASTAENSTLTLNNDTINANQANGATALGGGIYALESTVDVENSVINANEANGTVLGEGGGIYSEGGGLILASTKVKGNKATTSGGDIYIHP